MAREILFKAKSIDNGEWVYGNYAFEDTKGERHFIFQNFGFEYEVDKDTICQYTGLTDKNGRKIFENDVVRRQDLVFTSLRKKELRTKIGYVDFSCEGYGNGYWAFWWNEKSGRCNFGINDCCEVIGNIFDNPELLGGADNG